MLINLDDFDKENEEVKLRLDHQSEIIAILKTRADEYLTKYLKCEKKLKAFENEIDFLKNNRKLEIEKSSLILQENFKLSEENHKLKSLIREFKKRNLILKRRKKKIMETYLILLKKTNSLIKKVKTKDLSIKKFKKMQAKYSYENKNLLHNLSLQLKENINLKDYLTGKCKENELQVEISKIDLSKKNAENMFFQLTISQLKKELSDQSHHIDYQKIEIFCLQNRIKELESHKNFNEPDAMETQNLINKMHNRVEELVKENAAMVLKFETYKLYSEEKMKKEKIISCMLARLNIDSGYKI
ncbi:coiled-coil domain-containing protein 89-like [Hydra vulgaris]|uniref:Coiled-coil domain-containing protein 89-like n=1 Tax=Hydra vulgaris TaxID=6087 RepID=A0ABM4CXV3_HYDVU